MGSANWTRETLAWAAGIFEGEGCIWVSKKAGRGSVLQILMTDQDVLARFNSTVGLGRMDTKAFPNGRAEPHYRLVWRWRVSRGEEVQALLAALWPWLGERRRMKAVEALGEFRGRIGQGKRPYPLSAFCKRGHRYDKRDRSGKRVCLTCARDRARRRHANKKAEREAQK